MALRGRRKGTKFLSSDGLEEFLREKTPGKMNDGMCGELVYFLGNELLIRGSGVRIPSGVPRDYQLKIKMFGLRLVFFCPYDFERHQKGTKTGKNFCSYAETL